MMVVKSPRKDGSRQTPNDPESPSRRQPNKKLGNKAPIAPLLARTETAPAKTGVSDAIFSSSPAFATPAHPVKPFAMMTSAGTVLPILLPPATLRPLAFRTFTKKHSLTLTSSALQELAGFVGRHCGSGWREEGLAEKVCEEVARQWKGRNGGVIVDGTSAELKDILNNLEGCMSGGKVIVGGKRMARAAGLSRQNSLLLEPGQEGDHAKTRLGIRPTSLLSRDDSQMSMGMSAAAEAEHDDEDGSRDARRWLRVINAYEQPRLVYNVEKKHFERESSAASLLPPAMHKTAAFRNRFHVIHQRLLRNESFQTSAVADARAGGPSLGRSGSSMARDRQSHKITPTASLLGRHGSHHMVLGMLAILPTGELAVSDLTGTIALDLAQAVAVPEDAAWFAPGMMVLVDGVYEEEESVGKALSGRSGVGGTIGGRFQVFFIGQPPCEKRRVTLGVSGPDGAGPRDHTIGGGFGWIDFTGAGSERAVGPRMRRLEQRLFRQPESGLADDGNIMSANPHRGRMAIVADVHLDNARVLQALAKMLAAYASEPEGRTPMTFVLMGNFTTHAVMGRDGSSGGAGSGGSIEYKECFNALAATLSDVPGLLATATFVFVPGDNDAWAGGLEGGAAVPLPRARVPDVFTSRVRRAFAQANQAAGLTGNSHKPRGQLEGDTKLKLGGEAVWTTNPSRLTLFGPTHEVVLFRDDLCARLRRAAVRLKSRTETSGHGDDVVMSSANGSGNQAPGMGSHSPPVREEPDQTTHDTRAARRLVKTLLDQGFLAPFRTAVRPTHWDHASSLYLYPLPTAVVLADASAPAFCATYEGCHVVNPGPVLVPDKQGVARWVEYDFVARRGRVRESQF